MILHTFSSLFESASLTPEQTSFLNRYVDGEWVLNPTTGLVDVKGDVDFSGKKITSIPVRFGVVEDSFDCSRNQLVSLEGAPQSVGGGFYCSYNQLVSLEGAPQSVGVSFDCSYNQLVSLEGAPRDVGGIFYCSHNEGLVSLEGAPKEIRWGFYCDAFKTSDEKWGIEGWIDVLVTGSEKARSLILTILNSSLLNQEIEKDPIGMMMKLKGVWNAPGFASIKKEIVIPTRYREEMDTLGDLGELGF